jgi:hypothetical protein
LDSSTFQHIRLDPSLINCQEIERSQSRGHFPPRKDPDVLAVQELTGFLEQSVQSCWGASAPAKKSSHLCHQRWILVCVWDNNSSIRSRNDIIILALAQDESTSLQRIRQWIGISARRNEQKELHQGRRRGKDIVHVQRTMHHTGQPRQVPTDRYDGPIRLRFLLLLFFLILLFLAILAITTTTIRSSLVGLCLCTCLYCFSLDGNFFGLISQRWQRLRSVQRVVPSF